jgi:ABC-type transport system involved in multi-copper enzyme maturation permease subunit
MSGATIGRTARRFVPRLAMPGIIAIGVKELRGRMRGRRAFVSVTVYVVLVAGFAWMVGRILEENARNQFAFGAFDATYQSASIGRGIFVALMLLQTLMISVLAPASTAGTISSEREKQTLDLLAVTPISSVAIVVGKLLSALTWVFVLILASIPVTALVFVYGGVAPDDVVRGYLMLFVTAIAFGALGVFFSSLLRRSGAATGLTFVGVLVATVGLTFIWIFLRVTEANNLNAVDLASKRPPEALLYLNPFVAQADVACGTEGNTGGWCSVIDEVTGTTTNFGQAVPAGGFVGKGVVVGLDGVPEPMPAVDREGRIIVDQAGGGDGASADLLGIQRDRYWPRSALALLLLAVAFTAAAVQLVSPTRRVRVPLPRLPGRPRRSRPEAPAE